MNYSSVTNPTWADAEHSLIACNVNFDLIGDESEVVPFTASPNDVEAHGREIFERCVAGEFGPIAAYVAPPPPPTPTKTDLIAEFNAKVDQLEDLKAQIAKL
jgi:hypothetical protein